MIKSDVISAIENDKIIAVIRLNNTAQLLYYCELLIQTGIRCIEITLTMENALKHITDIYTRFGKSIILGAGSVKNAEQTLQALNAGAQYIVSPGFDIGVVTTAQKNGVTVIPGALTPTEVMGCIDAGADYIKIFPSSLGGAQYIKALKAPLPEARLIALGGVNGDTATAFIAAGASAIGAGSWLINDMLIAADDPSVITQRAQQLLAAVQ